MNDEHLNTFFRGLLNFPYPQICRHLVILEVLSLLEEKTGRRPNECFVKAVSWCYDDQALDLLNLGEVWKDPPTNEQGDAENNQQLEDAEKKIFELSRLIEGFRKKRRSRWQKIVATSPSGKTTFVCMCCGRNSPTPDKICPVPALMHSAGTKTCWDCAEWESLVLNELEER